MTGSDRETTLGPDRSTPPGGALAPGTLLNGVYRIEQRLGAGGMGEVYRATNLANDEQDAIKIIGRGRAYQTQIEAMFRKEARVLSRIRSPAVAQLKLFMRDPDLDLLYFITDFVPGESLLDRLRRQPAAPGELRALLARLLTGLQAVHEAGAVHRDLSPDNIILPDGDVAQAKIIDFGIVKELDPSHTTMIGDSFAGKLGYIAPEQLGFSGARIGPWTDLYSLALVGVAFAAGRPVDMGATLGRAEEARRGPIDLSPVPADLRPVFERLLTYDWRERPDSAAGVLATLDGETAPVATVAPPPPAPPPPGPPPPAPVPPVAAPLPAYVPGGTADYDPPDMASYPPAPRGQAGAAPVLIGVFALVMVVVAGVFFVRIIRMVSHASELANQISASATPVPSFTPAPLPAPTERAVASDPPPATPPRAVVTACGPSINVAFGPNLSAPTDGTALLIRGAIERAQLCRAAAVVVTGHAQTTEQQPFDLAQRRADTIASALRQAGMPGTPVTTKVFVASPDYKNRTDNWRLQAAEIGFVDP